MPLSKKKEMRKNFIHSAEGSNLFGLYKWSVRVRCSKLHNDQPYKYEGSITCLFTYLRTYLLTPRSRALLEKLTGL